MTRVLIITKNLLAEQSLQSILQRSNDEVYCSSDLMLDAQLSPQIIKYFSLVIFSDTISTLEVSKYYSAFKKNGLALLRKGRKNDLKNSECSYLIDEIDDWIDPETTDIEVIEKIAKWTSSQTKSSPLDSEGVVPHAEKIPSYSSSAFQPMRRNSCIISISIKKLEKPCLVRNCAI